MPNIADFSARLHSSKELSKLDLTKGGYYQVPKSSGDIPKTTVIMPFGLFEWLKMPFGLVYLSRAWLSGSIIYL